jgi:hypothetical protein
MTDASEHESNALPVEQALLFAPIQKRYFGTAIGCAAGLVIAALTLFHVVFSPEEDYPLLLLSEYFYGYRVSLGGVFIGAAWGFFVGFVAGWFSAFCRNLLLTTVIFWVRAKANLQASAEFLDHI